MLINLHTHRKPRLEEELAIRNAYHFPIDIGSLTYPISSGIHPWHLAKTNLTQAIRTIDRMLGEKEVIALGECGLDRAIRTDFQVQLHCFKQQIALAEKWHKPIIVHCVKAYEQMIPIARESRCDFILHGFKGHEKQLMQLLQEPNIYFSFGKRLMTETEKQIDLLKRVPADRFFLETDVSSYRIDQMYRLVSEELKLEISALETQIMHSFARIFQNNRS